MEAYFDNSATTRVLDSVRDIVVKTMTEDYGNAASKHGRGVRAEQYIREARSIIAKSLKVEEKEIIFTSGGSESNNMALIGAAMATPPSTTRWDSLRNRDLRSPIFLWTPRGT